MLSNEELFAVKQEFITVKNNKFNISGVLTSVMFYLKVARLDHWFKNIFVVIGIIAAISYNDISYSFSFLLKCCLAILLSCFISSSNYIINEIYDAHFDRRHPNKKLRSVAAGKVSIKKLVFINIFLITSTLFISYITFNTEFIFLILLFFIVGGIFYNIPPIRTKDLPFIDIISESINNPIRLMLGWFAVTNSYEFPIVAIAACWSFGAVLVTAKRLAEFRHLGERLVSYRPTFKYYSNTLLVIVYSVFILLTIGTFILLGMNYDSSIYLLLPALLIFLGWFSILTFQKNSITKEPERIFEKKSFVIYCLVALIYFAVTLLNKDALFL